VSARWRGLVALTVEAIERGSQSIERVQKETVARSLRIVGTIPPLATPAAVVQSVHDVVVGTTHAAVRYVSRAGGSLAAVVIDVLEKDV
jgi:hypothetical protein